jgi:hypothetical protein
LEEAKVEQLTASIQDTANTTRDRTAVGAQSTWDSAQLEKDQIAGFLQQVTISFHSPLEHAQYLSFVITHIRIPTSKVILNPDHVRLPKKNAAGNKKQLGILCGLHASSIKI